MNERTPIRLRRQVVQGQLVRAGIVLGLDGVDGSGHRMVKFECRHCRSIGRAQASELYSGKAKSCGCLAKKAFRTHQESRVKSFSRHTRARLFEMTVRHGATAAANLTGLDAYALSTATRLHREWLRRRPNLAELVSRARRIGNHGAVAAKFALSNGFEVVYLLRQWARLQDAAREKAQNAGEMRRQLISDLRFGIAQALDTLKLRRKEQRWNERAGEFSGAELSMSKTSQFGWILSYVEASGFIPSDMVATCDRFIQACADTFAARTARRIAWLRANNVGSSLVSC